MITHCLRVTCLQHAANTFSLGVLTLLRNFFVGAGSMNATVFTPCMGSVLPSVVGLLVLGQSPLHSCFKNVFTIIYIVVQVMNVK